MEYRNVGKTGCKSGIIGLGCEHLDRKPYSQIKEVVDTAIENDMNIFDVFMPGNEVRENIAKAIGNRRDKVMIQGHIGSTDINQQYDISRDMPVVQKYFEDLLRIFGGYIDFGMMFYIDSEKDFKGVFETEFVNYVQKLKKNGDIRHIGFSSHNPEMAMRAIETGVPEMLLFSVNLAFDLYPSETPVLEELEKGMDAKAFRGIDPKRAALYKLCEQKEIGITVMKTLGAGKLISPEHTPFTKPMTANQCIHYALTRPAVSSVLLGCKTGEEILNSLCYLHASDEERDYTPVMSTLRNDFKGSCVYCSHCQPCPAGIDIAAINKFLDIARLGGESPSVRSHYMDLEHSGSECIACGNCESRCPFGVPVIKNMAEAVTVFG